MRDAPSIPRDTGDSYANDVLPIFVAEETEGQQGPARLIAFCGTGFRLTDDLLVTCWHCVAAPEPERGGYAVAIQEPPAFRVYPLTDVTRDANGADLATARIYFDPDHRLPPPQLSLAPQGTISGTDVWTYGFPFTAEKRETDGPRFVLNGRLLRGYITRLFWYEHHSLGRISAYELDMRAPEGLSGAPLVYRPGDSVIGVIYGRHEVALIDEFSRVDPDTGVITPEVQRIESFGLACDTSTLFDVSTPVTQGRSLREFLQPAE